MTSLCVNKSFNATFFSSSLVKQKSKRFLLLLHYHYGASSSFTCYVSHNKTENSSLTGWGIKTSANLRFQFDQRANDAHKKYIQFYSYKIHMDCIGICICVCIKYLTVHSILYQIQKKKCYTKIFIFAKKLLHIYYKDSFIKTKK